MKTFEQILSNYHIDQNGKDNSYRVWWIGKSGATEQKDGFATMDDAFDYACMKAKCVWVLDLMMGPDEQRILHSY